MSEQTTLQEGDTAPNFELPANNGKIIKLSSFKGKQVVLYFYPKDLTPGCTQEACDFSSNLEAFQKKNTIILGISLDPIEKHLRFIEKYKLEHLLLSDLHHKTAELYGVYQEKSLYGKKFMGIVRSTFVVNEKQRIKKIFSKVKVNGHWKEVLEVL